MARRKTNNLPGPKAPPVPKVRLPRFRSTPPVGGNQGNVIGIPQANRPTPPVGVNRGNVNGLPQASRLAPPVGVNRGNVNGVPQASRLTPPVVVNRSNANARPQANRPTPPVEANRGNINGRLQANRPVPPGGINRVNGNASPQVNRPIPPVGVNAGNENPRPQANGPINPVVVNASNENPLAQANGPTNPNPVEANMVPQPQVQEADRGSARTMGLMEMCRTLLTGGRNMNVGWRGTAPNSTNPPAQRKPNPDADVTIPTSSSRPKKNVPRRILPTKRKSTKPKQGETALQDIQHYQTSTELLFPKTSFSRLVREVGQDYKTDVRFSSLALQAIQVATESYLIDVLEEANICALHAKRVTVSSQDIQLAMRIRGD